MDFFEIKKLYNEVRTAEIKEIRSFFKKHKDFEVFKAQKGKDDYTSGGRLAVQHDLSNWKWICVDRKGVHFLISLQPFERDPKSNNLHVLMDRIGIYAYTGNYSPIEAQTKMMITNIELPIDNEKLDELAKILKDLSELDIYKMQNQFEKVCSDYNLII